MKRTRKATALLEQMAHIERMERGKLCQMKGREHFNHQTWQKGRNLVRYVPRKELNDLQIAIDGYTRFRELAEHYADEIIRQTRREHARQHPRNPPPNTTSRKNSSRKSPD